MAQTVNLDVAKRVDIICRRNDTFELVLTIKDNTGVSSIATEDGFKMQVRTSDLDEGTALMNGLKVENSDGTSDTGSGTDGNIVITTNPAEATATFKCIAGDMDLESGLYVYDIQHLDYDATNPKTTTLIYGTFKIVEDVSI